MTKHIVKKTSVLLRELNCLFFLEIVKQFINTIYRFLPLQKCMFNILIRHPVSLWH